MAVMRYMVVVERGETSWGAHVPDLPGCVAVGETREEVLQLIREAIEFHIDGLKEDGLPVPTPSSEGEFVEGGDPVGDFEQSCRRLRVPIGTFPFTADGFIVHLGRGTLAGVYERRETSNAFFDWAADHHEPHFQQVPEAQAKYSALREEFDAAVGDPQPERLIAACRRSLMR